MRKRNPWIGGAAVAVALMTAMGGCSGTSTGTGSSQATPIPVGELPDAVAYAFCENIRPCCNRANVPFDLANCLREVVAIFQKQTDSSMSRRYDPMAGGACVAKVRTSMASCGQEPIEGHSCDWHLMVGTLPPGSPCGDARDCAPPALCQTSADGSLPGQCVATDAAKEGEPCAGDCYGEGGSNVGNCSTNPRISDGGFVIDESVSVCFTDAGLYCGPDGTCHGMGKVGAPCVPEGCVPGAVCDAKSDTCIKRPALKPPFAACKSGSECTSRVCTDGACVFGLALSCAHPFASEPAS